MNTRITLTLTLWMGLLAGSPAAAAITAFWQPVTITPEAIADDPVLASMQCWDLMSTTTGDWAEARMAATLPTGHVYYKHPFGTLARPAPAAVNSAAALAFTTFVSSPKDDGVNGATIVLSGHPQGQLFPNLGDAGSVIPGFFSIRWADRFLTVDPPGTYQLARLTFPLGVLPSVLSGGDPSLVAQTDPVALAFVPNIPEPRTSLFLAILTPLWLLRWQRAREMLRPG